ncbi:MAG: nucleoside hydrolase [Spirochaetales bacterium]|nr:nucleoside hydrolase [Spirochaetales bacterium]
MKLTRLLVLSAAAVALFISCATTAAPPATDGSSSYSGSRQKIILDCDNSMGSFFWEVDDGLVIAYLLNTPEVELLGITTGFGNRTYDHKYTVRQLKDAGRTDIPLYKGAQGPDEKPTEAARFLAETASRYPGEVTIIAAGPVANIEAASEIDPDFFDNVKQIVAMGGRTGEFEFGKRKVDELNLSADYEGSYKMLYSGCPVTVMTGQFCLEAPFYRSDLKKLDNFPVKWKRYLRNWLFTMKIGVGLDRFILWDLVAAVYAVHPEYFKDREMVLHSSPEDLESGYLRLDNGVDGDGAKINVPVEFHNRDAFYEDLFTAWNRQGR